MEWGGTVGGWEGSKRKKTMRMRMSYYHGNMQVRALQIYNEIHAIVDHYDEYVYDLDTAESLGSFNSTAAKMESFFIRI